MQLPLITWTLSDRPLAVVVPSLPYTTVTCWLSPTTRLTTVGLIWPSITWKPYRLGVGVGLGVLVAVGRGVFVAVGVVVGVLVGVAVSVTVGVLVGVLVTVGRGYSLRSALWSALW